MDLYKGQGAVRGGLHLLLLLYILTLGFGLVQPVPSMAR
jgi:hypothetical protein